MARLPMHAPGVVVCALLAGTGLPAGCASRPPPLAHQQPVTTGSRETLSSDSQGFPAYHAPLNARVSPPSGWLEQEKPSDRPNVRHVVWISPSGRTAFGVLRFRLPLPLPHEPLLWVFLHEMKRNEGEATILSKAWDRALPGLRFEVEGGKYRLRTSFRIRGLEGWMVYAGTLRNQPVDSTELHQAESAREATKFGAAD
ncbi:MAG: hypothetical protein NZ561_08520 [Phycisphaerae bacterium]|nr:hypothetical protein [Phycisphaerae bacterium]MDW8263347.1 hypothetical protein [Phycisphaerales bacterium]